MLILPFFAMSCLFMHIFLNVAQLYVAVPLSIQSKRAARHLTEVQVCSAALAKM